MSLWKIAWRSLQQRALSSWLTGFSMALGVSLVIAVVVIHGVVARHFGDAAQGYHMIVGAKGGKMQLVLNTVFHLSQPIENIPWSTYNQFREYEEEGETKQGKWAAYTQAVVPLCLGDSLRDGDRDYRVVGTTPDLFDKLSYGALPDGTPLNYQFAEGRNFKTENFREAVIGSVVANQTGLKVGDGFPITHGLADNPDAHVHEEDIFTIVGILEPTGTPNDRAAFINMEGFYLIADHYEGELPTDEQGNPLPLPPEDREVTALLVLLDPAYEMFGQSIRTQINEGNVAQAVYPQTEVANLFESIVGPAQLLLLALAVLVVIVAAIGVMVSIYNSMAGRTREIAIMRALGAGRGSVMAIVLLESILLSLLGGLGGVLLGHGLIALINPEITARTGVSISPLHFETAELILVPALVVLASLVGFVPALTAYRTDVAKNLSGGE